MGREIRRVPVGWEHPKETRPEQWTRKLVEAFIPMYDTPYLSAALEWDEGWALWQSGEHPAQLKDDSGRLKNETFEEYEGTRPTPTNHRPDWTEEEANGWCVYETVSEGTPVTPVFATPEELIDYLVENGDFWDQRRRKTGSTMPCDPWDREAATRFVMETGWAPSFVMVSGQG